MVLRIKHRWCSLLISRHSFQTRIQELYLENIADYMVDEHGVLHSCILSTFKHCHGSWGNNICGFWQVISPAQQRWEVWRGLQQLSARSFWTSTWWTWSDRRWNTEVTRNTKILYEQEVSYTTSLKKTKLYRPEPSQMHVVSLRCRIKKGAIFLHFPMQVGTQVKALSTC